MSIGAEEKKEIRKKVAKPLLWIAIVSMIMMFAGLTSAAYVRKEKGDWLKFDMPVLFYVSTALIIISSITMNWAVSSAKKDRQENIKTALLLTLLLGMGFVLSQWMAWGNLVDQKVYFAGKSSNAAGSFLYVLTALHLLHLAGGIISLAVTLWQASMEKYNSGNLLGLQLCATYWHFLDILWVYLFLFLLFIH